MKKQVVLFFITAILSLNGYSQISFEKGYYIDNANHKTTCLIKNIDWKNNPTKFEYKLSENSESQRATIPLIKEFGIDSISKYVRTTVNIDRSMNDVHNLSTDKNPIFNEEELFLKVLVEGKSNLYEYVDGNLKRYFYTNADSNIEQLIFKSYKPFWYIIAENNAFRQQLWNNLKCPNFKKNKIENIDYDKNNLVRLFVDYSECHNAEFKNFETKQKRNAFNLAIRPRLRNSSFRADNNANNTKTTAFNNKTGFGIGLEAEYILPFNKNKWAIAIEPTYQNFKGEKETNVRNVQGGVLKAALKYSSIEIPVGLRHYMFLSEKSKLFLNASIIADLTRKSSFEFTRADGSSLESVDIKSRTNLAFGFGYKLSKLSLEARYQTSRDILSDYLHWEAYYRTVSIIFGYSLF
ncbi:PorT family protein [Aurantibacter crassamenti]|uniref:autotransporter outer membrane beta-barrel domain-containing protein n=1 Tax=Aurantibacter crassamenti TaxID=1837375 RepID=UPI001939CF77|nr:autotransporter outer membrane beta-barrel domain-containing protein [Aurantibacter crassamenti]MBM1107297.1 PorT family protein [Aurantibacter crassamenti]